MTPRAGPLTSTPALGLLLFILFSPTVLADGEPQRLSVSVFNVQWLEGSGAWDVDLCPRWTEATVGDSYAITAGGVDFAINVSDVPFRPTWLWPDPDNCFGFAIPGIDSTLDFAVSACSGCSPPTTGTILATSCNVTISPLNTFSPMGTSYMCGSPGYVPDLRLSGSGEVSGNDTIFRLNHSISGRNATMYQYQYTVASLPVEIWFNIEPTSSGTIDGGNLSVPASEDGYRLANFTFEDTAADSKSRILWRVRASDTFTQETSPYSCVLALVAASDSFSKSCHTRRFLGADTIGPEWPMVNLTNMGNGLGVSALAAGGILLAGLAGTLAAIVFLTSRSTIAAVGASSLALAGGWIYNVTPGWVLVIGFYAASLIILARIMPGGNE